MKKMTRTLFLAGCFLGTAVLANAQQQVATAGSLNSLTPITVTGYGTASSYNNDYDKKFKEEDLKSKEVSKEIAVPKGGEIYIENSSRGIVVKTWDQPKVKVTTTVFYDGESKLTDEEWLEKVNLSLKTLGSSVKIKSGSPGSSVFYSNSINTTTMYGSSGNGGVAVFNGNGQNIGTKGNLKRIVTVTVPVGSKLDIESKYSDITLPASIGDVTLDISNGNLEADNLNKLVLRSKYSNANIGDVKTAEVEFNNGRFSAKNIDDLDIDSKYSTIEMAAVKKLVLRSTNDEYELEDAGDVRGRKSYGNLRITKLNGSMDVEGTNADVKVRKVGPSLSLIKLDDKYADVRIPLRENKNYTVDFAGYYSSVYGNFEKKEVKEEKVTDEKAAGTIKATTIPGVNNVIVDGRQVQTFRGALSSYSTSNFNSSTGPSRFTATVGDGKGLKIEMKCQNCTVDFK
ncbi:MAG: hypothetical protein V4450_00435 [Bacteroidota bacterium]